MTQYMKWGVALLGMAALVSACGGGDAPVSESETAPVEIYKPAPKANPNGVGPVAELTLEAFDPALAAEGEQLFNTICVACHRMDQKLVGPPLANVLDRRSPAWVMNMILNPDGMLKEDPTAMALLAEYVSPMTNQNLSEAQARSLVEYLRQEDTQAAQP